MPSPRNTAASTNESSGATPTSTAVRAAPAKRTADTNTTCEMPGTTAPIAANTSTSRRSMWSANEPVTSATSATTTSPSVALTVAPTSTRHSAREPVADGDGVRAEEHAGERTEEDGIHGARA